MISTNAHPHVKVTGRHLQITDAISDYCTRKIESLHLDYPKIIEAHVILEVEKYRHSAEVVLVCSNHITIEACEETNDMYAAIDAVTDKVARQMRKYKTRLMRKHRPRKDIVQHLEEHVLHPEPTEEDEHPGRSPFFSFVSQFFGNPKPPLLANDHELHAFRPAGNHFV